MKNLIKIGILVAFLVTSKASFCMEDDTKYQSQELTSLRCMSYNIRRDDREATAERTWPNRQPLVVGLWKTINPDIVGLQEPIRSQVKDLEQEFPYMGRIGKGRGTNWWGLSKNEYNPIFWDKDKLTLLEHETFPVNRFHRFGWMPWMPWDVWQTGWLSRICTVGKFKVKETQQEFFVYNTHFDHQFHQARKNSANIVAHDIERRTKMALPIILMGDLNTEFSEDFKKAFSLLQHAREKARRVKGPRETSTGWDDSKKLKQQIDHILVHDSDVTKYGVVEHKGDVYPSDHRPVFADINF